MINVGIIVLIGHGNDVDVKLVSVDTMEWIRNEQALVPQMQINTQDDSVRAGFIESAQDWEGSSPDNDRALNANSEYGVPGSLDSVIEALNFAKKNNLNIYDSFEGYIY